MFVTQMGENKSATVELVTRSEFFLFFNLELVTRKRKNKSSLTIELVTQSVTFCFSTSS